VPSFAMYAQTQLAAWSGQVNWGSDDIVATLHTAAYAPNLVTNGYVSSLAGEVATGGGYTQGGLQLTGCSASYLPAASWPDAWAPLTPYAAGAVIRPALSASVLLYCYQAGASGASAPSWPSAPGAVVADGGAAWSVISAGAVALVASPLQWPSFTASFRYVVISDRQSGNPATEPLIGLIDMGTTVSGTGGNLSVSFDGGSGSGIVIPLWSP
jgi:hypothetical protein